MNKIKYWLLFLTAVLSHICTYGQDCVRLIRTKYDSSVNNELPTFFPGDTNPWLNSFDFAEIDNGTAFADIQLDPLAGWTLPSGNGYKMKSPFSVAMPSQYSYLSQPFGVGSSVYDADIWWEDGWELMWLNTGYYPNGERIGVVNANRILSAAYGPANPNAPYMILYNRYTGKLRVFANLFADYNAFNKVRMWLFHPDNQPSSGIFRHLLNYDQTLDEPSRVTEVSSYNFKNVNNYTEWWSADYQLGYDPCVCQHQSKIEFWFKAIKQMNVDLFGRYVEQNIDLEILGNPDYNNFLTNESVKSGLNSGQGGSLLFKRFDNLMNQYDSALDYYNTALHSYNSPFNSALRDVLKAAKDGVADAGAGFLVKPMGDFFLRQLVKIGDTTKGDTTQAKAWAQEVSKAAKGGLGKGFDFLTVAGLGEDFFKEPQRPVMPTATFGEMRIAGTISDSGDVHVSNFLTPGSYKYPQQLTPFNYPAYNEAVGLYALLRKPVVKGFQEGSTTTSVLSIDTVGTDTTVINGVTTIFVDRQETENWEQHNLLSLRLDEPLKYKLNRALDFDDSKTKLYVSFVVEVENGLPNTNNCFTLNLTQKDNENFYLRDIFPVSGTTSYQLIYETLWKDIEDIGTNLFKMDFINSFQPIAMRTNTMTINGSDTDFIVGQQNLCVDALQAEFKIKKIKMKVAADMYFHQKGKNGLQNSTFQTFTYLLYDPDNEIYDIDFRTDSSELLRYKQANLVLTDEVIEQSDPFVFETIGRTIYVNAKNIELNGNITVDGGFNAVLQATKNITAKSSTNTQIGQEIRLKRVKGFSPFDNVIEMTDEEVESFCNDQDNGYKAIYAASKMGDTTIQHTPVEPEHLPKTSIYPNPATNVFYIEIAVDEEKEYRFQVFDLTGRTLINETVKGSGFPQFEITTDRLSGGTYFLKVASNDGVISETHKIVILK